LGVDAVGEKDGMDLLVAVDCDEQFGITGGQRAVPRRALDGGFDFAEPEIEPALRNLLRR
jgi:NAD dependent epimerase/dehydratase family enzyme